MRILILTTVMAPYRVNLFNELGKLCDLTVCFEQQTDSTRNSTWYEKNTKSFNAVFLKKWDRPIRKIKFDILNYINKGFDIAIAFEYSTTTAFLFMLACKLKKIPYCINCDGAFISHHIIKDFVKKFFISGATACLANGEFAKKYFIHYGAHENKIFSHHFTGLYKHEYHYPQSRSIKSNMKQELGLPNIPVVLSVGQFTHRKGFDLLLNAWKTLDSKYHLVIIGAGERLEEYKEIIQHLSLKNISIKPFLCTSDLNKYYDCSDLFVLPTREDIWGLVINEALSKGLPVITTNKCIAGLELIVDGQNGFIIPSEDINTLSERIEYSLSNLDTFNIDIDKLTIYSIENLTQELYTTFTHVTDIK